MRAANTKLIENALKTSKVIQAEQQFTVHKLKQIICKHKSQFAKEREEVDKVMEFKSTDHCNNLENMQKTVEKECQSKATLRMAKLSGSLVEKEEEIKELKKEIKIIKQQSDVERRAHSTEMKTTKKLLLQRGNK